MSSYKVIKNGAHIDLRELEQQTGIVGAYLAGAMVSLYQACDDGTGGDGSVFRLTDSDGCNFLVTVKREESK